MYRESSQNDRDIQGAIECLNHILPNYYQPPLDWAIENISFRSVIGAAKDRLDISISPFLREPINEWDFTGKKEVTVVAIEQTGKTLVWLIGLLWTYIFRPTQSLVVYKSDEMAEKINSDKFKPLMYEIPQLALEMQSPRSFRKDHYNFSNLKSYFMGSGTRITSLSSQINVADEIDDWIEHEGQVANLDDLRKRARFYSDSILYKVCSVKGGGNLGKSTIWAEFEKSSMGYWTLQCQKCKEHTIRSCDIRHLQFESDDDYKIIQGTCLLVCPKCGYAHEEKHRANMTQNGKFVHEVPELVGVRSGYQWGALAVLIDDFQWDKVAQAQLIAGQSGALEDQLLFDNSFRGLPFSARRKDERREKILKRKMVELPDTKTIRYRLMSIDTQDDCFYWLIRGFDEKGNNWPLRYGRVVNFDQLTDVWEGSYHGGRAIMGMIDAGGHRAGEVAEWVVKNQGLVMYKGRGHNTLARWQASKETNKMILAQALNYQAEMLYLMYSAENRGNNYWFLNKQITPEYLSQLLDLRPDNKKRDGNEYKNWHSATGQDHYFDCEKMMLVARDVYKATIKKQQKPEKRKAKVPINQ